jgi:hypothetical protein
MSTWGRAQDILCDYLYGYEDGSGKFYPGPLYESYRGKFKELTEIVEGILERIAPTFEEFGERVARKRLLAEMAEHGISFGPKSEAKVRWQDT